MKNKLLLILLLLFCSFSFSQYNIETYDGQTINTCTGTFVDSGGVGSDYEAGESYTVTFCPDVAGSRIEISFTQVDLEYYGSTVSDALKFWNANSISGTEDGIITSPTNLVSLSPDGCVTFEFTSDGSLQYSGWEATISCSTPCSPPTAVLADTSILDICNPNALNPGSLTVNFDASGSTAVGSASIA
jgi:hypothetical protein